MTLSKTFQFASVVLIGLATTALADAPRRAFLQRDDGQWTRHPDGCGTHQRPGDIGAREAPAPSAVGLRTIYLNRFGGRYTAGPATDAKTNVSATTLAVSEATIAPLDLGTFNWPNIVACVRTHFARFNVRIVETEPNAGQYIEAVVGGDAADIGREPGSLFGVASADSFCGVTERGIAFNFSEAHRGVGRRDDELCATIAHEVGHLIALEHEQLPIDVMSYVLIADSNTKAFVDAVSGCGTDPETPNPCSCSGSSTNSAARLTQFIGLKATETVAPVLSVSAPGETVLPEFDVVATATDNDAMSDVTVQVDGIEVGNDFVPDGDTYTISLRGVSDGDHTLVVIATDAAGNQTTEERAVRVQRLVTGEDCTANELCEGGICAMTAEGGFCTEACQLAADDCPSGFECAAAGSRTVCLPIDDGGGCCSSSTNPGAALLLGLGIVVLVFRRRRPTRRG